LTPERVTLEGYVPEVDATVVTRSSTPAVQSPAKPRV